MERARAYKTLADASRDPAAEFDLFIGLFDRKWAEKHPEAFAVARYNLRHRRGS